MSTNFIILFKILIFIVILQIVNGYRTKDRMYEEIISKSACFRRLNGTHQIGCSSKIGGSTGVIHFCEEEEDLNTILKEGTAEYYIPILPSRLFNQITLENMIESNKVSGLILHSNNDSLVAIRNFTHEHQCPNPYSSVENTCRKESPWNPLGTGLLYRDIPFPIFYVDNEKDIANIKDCFNKFNNFSYHDHSERSLCSLELKSFMYATTDTPTCIRRSSIVSNLNPQKFCDPLGDINIWASLHPLVEGPRTDTKPLVDYKYIVISTRLDSTSMFEETAGANSPITGIVTLLSLAKYLNDTVKLEDVRKAKKNVLFFLFNGESYDYIGSQRMLYDMLEGNFPVLEANKSTILPQISPENIELFVEISQLGNSDKKVYTHYLNESAEVNNFITKLQEHSDFVVKINGSLPPGSVHTFLKNNASFPGLMISDHQDSFTNKFYNSIYDNGSNIQFQYYNASPDDTSKIPKDSIQYYLANVTKIVGNSIIEYISGKKYSEDAKVDVCLIDELLYCYVEDPNCRVHQAIQNGLKFPKTPISLYVGVKGNENDAASLAGLTLGWFTGKSVGPGNINCTNKPRNYAFRYYNMSKNIYELNTTMCYQITMNTTEAVSPAFSIRDYDWSSGQYSTWSESIWKEFNVRIFLKPSAIQGRMTVAIGCISLVFSFIIVYFIKSRSHLLFLPTVPSEAPTDC